MLSLGAINKQTRQYVYPKIASKKDQYVCPECDKDLILCQGTIRIHHFRHKVDHVNPCHHYDHPSEAQIHKDAKLVLKTMLDNHVPLSFVRACIRCRAKEEYEVPPVTETSAIVLEHRFSHKDKLAIADVAYLDQDTICCLFEICNTHQTKEGDRPEPWFEINADTLIQQANDRETSDGVGLVIPCIRETCCDDCSIALRQIELATIDMNKLKQTDLEKYVRIKLGQNTFPGDADYPDPSQPRVDHLRLDFDADRNIENNKMIMELFDDDFMGKKVVVHSHKGVMTTYVVSSASLYNRYDYWNDDNMDNMPYPCEETIDQTGEKTVTILADLILYCQEAHEIKQSKIKKLKQAISNGIYHQKMNRHSNDIATQMTNIRSYQLYSNAVKALNQELALVENDIWFWMVNPPKGIHVDERRISAVEVGSEEIIIRRPSVGGSRDSIVSNEIRRNLFTNETKTVHGKPLRQNITIQQIIKWYNSLTYHLSDESK